MDLGISDKQPKREFLMQMVSLFRVFVACGKHCQPKWEISILIVYEYRDMHRLVERGE